MIKTIRYSGRANIKYNGFLAKTNEEMPHKLEDPQVGSVKLAVNSLQD